MHIIVALALVGTAGTVVLAQTYQWTALGVVSASWAANGAHIYNTNAGSVVVGSLTPDGSLLLDVAGQIGATEYCDENGTASSCFAPYDMTWRLSGTDVYNTNAGNIGIGTSDPSSKLEVNGSVLANAYYYTSDEKLKTNIRPVEGLDIITQLEGVRFDWKETGESSIGLIAQEVEQVLPELVATNPEGQKAVQYGDIVAVLIQALREQDAQLGQLRSEIEALQQ